MAVIAVPRTRAKPASPPMRGPRTSRGRKVRDNLTGYAFLIGAVLCFALFAWYPMIRGVIMSFQRTRRGVTTWVGWDNYDRIITDPSFATAWKNTIYFTCLALVFGYAVPFFVAILLNELRHARGYLRAVACVVRCCQVGTGRGRVRLA